MLSNIPKIWPWVVEYEFRTGFTHVVWQVATYLWDIFYENCKKLFPLKAEYLRGTVNIKPICCFSCLNWGVTQGSPGFVRLFSTVFVHLFCRRKRMPLGRLRLQNCWPSAAIGAQKSYCAGAYLEWPPCFPEAPPANPLHSITVPHSAFCSWRGGFEWTQAPTYSFWPIRINLSPSPGTNVSVFGFLCIRHTHLRLRGSVSLLLRKSQEFGEMWARNHGQRPK